MLGQDGTGEKATKPLTPQQLDHIADLAHLTLDPNSVDNMLKNMESIVRCTRSVQDAVLHTDKKSTDVYSMDGAGDERTPLREDTITEGGCPKTVLSNAARVEGSFFSVPNVSAKKSDTQQP